MPFRLDHERTTPARSVCLEIDPASIHLTPLFGLLVASRWVPFLHLLKALVLVSFSFSKSVLELSYTTCQQNWTAPLSFPQQCILHCVCGGAARWEGLGVRLLRRLSTFLAMVLGFSCGKVLTSMLMCQRFFAALEFCTDPGPEGRELKYQWSLAGWLFKVPIAFSSPSSPPSR
ncbi:hypothetical protein M405DRAFT_241814 [Rhizopogon salebrosus TDB-379]|nr:hypothetical protein M405DRAFT_241814 [Rhizopogon salebrosus TDB-379]